LVNAISVNIEFPAVIDATNSAFFITAKIQAGAAVRAGFLNKTDQTIGVTKREQTFAHQCHPDRRAIGLRYLSGKESR
jgi:hypothetical protein